MVGESKVWKDAVRWQVDPIGRECKNITLLTRLDRENRAFMDFYVVPSIDRARRFHLRKDDVWLNRGKRLVDLSHFGEAVNYFLCEPK